MTRFRFNHRHLRILSIALFFIFSLSGFASGSRSFSIVFILILTIIFLTSKNYIRIFLGGVIVSVLPFITNNRLYTELLTSSRYEAWLEALSYNTLDNFSSISLKSMHISSFHNVVFDSLYVYGYFSFFIFLVLLYFISISIKRVLKVKGLDFFIGIMFVAFLIVIMFTTVVVRGDVMILFMGFSFLILWCKFMAQIYE